MKRLPVNKDVKQNVYTTHPAISMIFWPALPKKGAAEKPANMQKGAPEYALSHLRVRRLL
jgi:hypothetical protein